MKKSILYLHGFNSAAGGKKVLRLKEMLPEYDVLNPTIDFIDLPMNICNELSKQITHHQVKMVVGSSMGGFYALYLSAKNNIPCVLVNPCIVPDRTLAKFVGINKNYVTGEKYEVTEKHVENYRKFIEDVFEKDVHPKPELVNIALATDDELLGDTHEYLINRFPARKVLYFDNCGHIFNQFKKLELLFREVLVMK